MNLDEHSRQIKGKIHMKLILILTALCMSHLAISKQMEITCEYLVDEDKYSEYDFGVEYGLDIGDVWTSNRFMFDTDDFSNGKGTAQLTQEWSFIPGNEVSNIAYTVNPSSIVFDRGSYSTSINRKTLKIGEAQVTPYRCSIAEVDTSDNLF